MFILSSSVPPQIQCYLSRRRQVVVDRLLRKLVKTSVKLILFPVEIVIVLAIALVRILEKPKGS